MKRRLFWSSLVVQAVVVGALFAILAVAFEKEFFEDYGFAIGPISWIVCSLITARIVSLPAGIALFAALAGGVAGFLVGLVAGHLPGLVVALLVFAASCGGYDPERDAAAATGGG